MWLETHIFPPWMTAYKINIGTLIIKLPKVKFSANLLDRARFVEIRNILISYINKV